MSDKELADRLHQAREADQHLLALVSSSSLPSQAAVGRTEVSAPLPPLHPMPSPL